VAALAVLDARPENLRWPGLSIDVPATVVVATDVFDAFVSRNGLGALADTLGDRELAVAFQRADLPAEVVGDLWDLVRQVRQPLAVRSSSLLEDALAHPLAGVYLTKMIPNNQHDPESRFRRLVEAIKLVYASTFFSGARAYRKALGPAAGEEKMAVIVQEVVGRRHGPRFYPDLSAVARSFSFYPLAGTDREDGVVDLALGLGKTIVEGERCWTACPRWPGAVPPFGSTRDLMRSAQARFWSVNMGPPPPYDPVAETEYLTSEPLAAAEQDGTLVLAASTYDPASDRLRPGTGTAGVRVLDFAPLRTAEPVPVTRAVKGLLDLFQERLETPVEIELALTFEDGRGRLGFLQVRPMAIGSERVALTDADLADPSVVVASARALGNGRVGSIRDVLFVKRERFEMKNSRDIARQVAEMNAGLAAQERSCVLVGFGRWGSADPWLGVPVAWEQVSAARVIVEAALPGLSVEMSQGAHFFHNLMGLDVPYLSVPDDGRSRIDWEWIESLPRAAESPFVCHAEVPGHLRVEVDGWSGRGRIVRAGEGTRG
jgi:Pyruvate phosphate dikinase, AMP/ATP-binding domain